MRFLRAVGIGFGFVTAVCVMAGGAVAALAVIDRHWGFIGMISTGFLLAGVLISAAVYVADR